MFQTSIPEKLLSSILVTLRCIQAKQTPLWTPGTTVGSPPSQKWLEDLNIPLLISGNYPAGCSFHTKVQEIYPELLLISEVGPQHPQVLLWLMVIGEV